ncbi:MAG: Nucleoside-diphosphate-sugar epimerase [Candidatus Uhrbacteria bacterium GW2011_GWF2_39_13]|uniref:Nucleoside-diphosphate-sugar epimerase n=1 Tax=Candidatus Uhrbacteria bacterium GW2011_GWF2_39_13 TaxID=1618995 RepID=A0A0G0MKS4_9BACT|nr:MAG: Nucleoside-diphosphate-sugar epimerase [Candidatus Uhrbacteria bacterium GW2011_GWF2_39_13]HAU66720.1 UDP-glucose 4-epimerase [Candidatus Uhrbacteria bacterium]
MAKKFQTALVTGGAGFIGSHIVDALIRRHIKVYVVDDFSTGQKKNVNPNAHVTRLSILNPQFVPLLQKIKPDVVFHLAAQINLRDSLQDPLNDAKINIFGTLTLIQECTKLGVKKIIYSSTGGPMYPEQARMPWSEKIHPQPISPYGISKRSAEMYFHYAFQVHGMPYVALRYANVYGPRQNAKGEAGVISIFADHFMKGNPMIIHGSGEQTRDFVFVEDVVRANISAMDRSAVGVFNIGTGKQTSINTIFRKLKKMTQSSIPERHDAPVMGEVIHSALSSREALIHLGWRPTVKLDQGLEKTVAWMHKR